MPTTTKRPPAAKKTTPAKPATKRPPAAAKSKQSPKTAADVTATAAALHPTNPMVASVPDMKVADSYVHRDVNGLHDFDMFDYCYETGTNLLLEGPTGPGKTMVTRAWAAKRGRSVARIPSHNGIDASQLFGKFNPKENAGGFVWVDGPIPHVFRYGGVILWNEINFTPVRVGSVMFGALDDNREIILLDHDGEVLRAHRGAGNCWCKLDDATCDDRRVLIVADMNPGYAGTQELNDALRNRFGMQVNWGYDRTVEKLLVTSKTVLDLADLIRGDEAYETPCSTNMLIEFERIANDLGVNFAIGNFINHFRVDERDPLALVMEAHKGGIQNDMVALTPESKSSEPDPELQVNADDAPSDDAANDQKMADWLFGEA